MKPIATVIRAVLAAALFATLPGSAQPPATPAAPSVRERVARFDAAEAALLRRLATPQAARAFRLYNAANSQKIQHHLAVIYGADPDWVRDAAAAGKPLGDSIVGPVTLKWLTRFCRDYGIVGSEPGFERVVVDSLEQVAGIARAHPDWLKILASVEFDEWISSQPDARRVQSLRLRRSGAASQVNALIEQYLRERRAPLARQQRAAAPLELTYGFDPKRPTRVANLDQIAERLKTLVERPADTEERFVDDVRAALYDQVLTDDTLALIKRYSQVDAYLVDAELLRRLRREGLPEVAVTEIRDQMEDVEYLGTGAFLDALAEVAAGSVHAEAIDRKRLMMVRQARQARFRVPATLSASLAADDVLLPAVAAVFASFQNIEYPTRELFDDALQFQVRRALNMCGAAHEGAQGALQDDAFAALAALMPEHGAVFERIGQLRAVHTGCSVLQLVDADALAYQAHLFISPRLDRKMDLDIRHAMPTPKPRESAWAPTWCQCGRPERNGLIYGFYPLWTDAGERQMDFGALSRIGLYGLTADQQGVLHGPPGMDGTAIPAHLGTMMRAAHQHNVKVDWVIARSDWRQFAGTNRAAKEAVLASLSANIVTLLERPLKDGGQLLTRLGSLGLDAGPTGGDGVTLYFRDFPAADKDLFNEFVVALSDRLKKMRPARHVSLMADYHAIGTSGPFDYHNLITLIQRTNQLSDSTSFASSGNEMVTDMPILVLMPEPTQDTKKALRNAIQDSLRGTEGVRLLWAMLPVLEYDGVGSRQLVADIVNISADYHGIGFWPLAFTSPGDHQGTSADDTKSANRLIELNYQPVGDPPSALREQFGYLCPHRLWLRWVFWGSLVLALGVGAVYFSCRGCNERLDNSGLYFTGMMALLALPLVALSVLVLSDPLLARYSQVALVLYGTGGIAAAALVARYYFNESRRKLP